VTSSSSLSSVHLALGIGSRAFQKEEPLLVALVVVVVVVAAVHQHWSFRRRLLQGAQRPQPRPKNVAVVVAVVVAAVTSYNQQHS
jgi:hypothetical protein